MLHSWNTPNLLWISYVKPGVALQNMMMPLLRDWKVDKEMKRHGHRRANRGEGNTTGFMCRQLEPLYAGWALTNPMTTSERWRRQVAEYLYAGDSWLDTSSCSRTCDGWVNGLYWVIRSMSSNRGGRQRFHLQVKSAMVQAQQLR